MLPIFGGTLPGLVLHSTRSFFFFVFLISFSHHDRPFQLASWQNCINTEARNLYFRALHGRLSCCTDGSALKEKYQQTQQTLLSPIPNQHTLCRPIIPSPPTTANLLICPISPLQSNCSPSLEIAYHRPSLSPNRAVSPKLPPSSNTFSPARQTCASTDTHLRSATTRCSSLTLLSPLPHLTLRPLTPLP